MNVTEVKGRAWMTYYPTQKINQSINQIWFVSSIFTNHNLSQKGWTISLTNNKPLCLSNLLTDNKEGWHFELLVSIPHNYELIVRTSKFEILLEPFLLWFSRLHLLSSSFIFYHKEIKDLEIWWWNPIANYAEKQWGCGGENMFTVTVVRFPLWTHVWTLRSLNCRPLFEYMNPSMTLWQNDLS